MGENNTLIELYGITFGYPLRPYVLDELNFSFSKGERIGFIGANGSGKTTLFYIIMGLLRPLEGEVRVFGEPRVAEPDFREVRERIGFLFQDADDQLFCPTVAEDIAFGPLNLGKTHDEVHEIVTETLEILGLMGFEDRMTHNLSGGEKKLVSLATVIAMKPEILLLDEPTSGLDEDTTERIIEFLTNNTELSYIIISHDYEFLERATHYSYQMNDGKMEEKENRELIRGVF